MILVILKNIKIQLTHPKLKKIDLRKSITYITLLPALPHYCLNPTLPAKSYPY